MNINTKLGLLHLFIWIGAISSFFILSLTEWLVCIFIGWVLGLVAQPVAIHRYFTHRAFETNRFWHHFLLLHAILACEGSPLMYKSIHIKHHRYTDQESDPHSPTHLGAIHTFFPFFRFLYSKPKNVEMNLLYARDLLRDTQHVFVNEHYFKIHFVYFATLLAINPILVYPFYIFTAWTAILGGGFVNTFCHIKGRPDDVWIYTALFADGHHKYHHDNASDYRQPFPIWTNTFIKLIKSNQH